MACEHCGEVSVAIQTWPQYVHDNCDCLCHRWKTKKGQQDLLELKKYRKPRKKKY